MKSLKLILTAVVLISVLAFSAYAATVRVTEDFSLAQAYASLNPTEDNVIILETDATYVYPGYLHSGHLTIKSEEGKHCKYIFPDTSSNKNMQICGSTTFENIQFYSTDGTGRAIYATGFPLVIKDTVTTSTGHSVYGGMYGGTVKGDTNIEVHGGNYSFIYGGGQDGCIIKGDTNITVGGNVNIANRIYGGGNSNSTVEGSTYITVGGNINSGNSTNDNESNFKDTRVYGGGNGATVGKSTNITYKDNAIFAYVFGAGYGANGTVGVETNVNIQGGQVMNVYGGSESVDANCNTNVYMKGGTVEAIFGASHTSNFTGNANTYLFGGKVTRRVYSGCYNNAISSTYSVVGNTFMAISNGIDLSSLNEGIYAGSINTDSSKKDFVVYVDNSYDSKNKYVKKNGWLISKDYADYVVKAGTGGTILSANEAGKIKVVPDFDKYAIVNSKDYLKEVVDISSLSSPVEVSFATNYSLTTATAAQAANGIEISVAGTFNAAGKDLGEKIIASVYDETGRCLGCKILSSDATPAVFECETPAGKTYTVKYNVIAGFARAFAPMAPAKTATVTFN